MIADSCMDKKTKGGIAELAVAAKLMKIGWSVAFPYGERSRYDLIAEKKGKFIRVQVKYSTPKNGALRVNCRSSNNWSVLRYTADQIDVIAAYNPEDGQIYFIPANEINGSVMNLRLREAKNKQLQNVRFAEDYEELTYSMA